MEQKRRILSDSIDILEIGKVDDIASYKEIVFESIGFELPIVICSDNHNINDYQLKENLWIKSNPNFEGLRQIIFEPSERVRIQGNKPEEKSGYQVIESINLNRKGFWQSTIKLNSNLNTIIGGRSTGKSTLLKSIAYKINSKILKDDSFIEEHVNSIDLTWKDGESERQRDIQFFPQSHMYEIAISEEKTNNLIQEIVTEKDRTGLYEGYEKYCAQNRTEIINDINNVFQLQADINLRTKSILELGDKEGIKKEIELLNKEIAEIKKELISHCSLMTISSAPLQ